MNPGRRPKTHGKRRFSSCVLSSRLPREGKQKAARARLFTRTLSEARLEISCFCIQLSRSPILSSSCVPLWPLPDRSTNVEQKERFPERTTYLVARLQYYQSLITVYGYGLAVADAPARLARTQHRWETELACDDRAVGKHATDIGHQAACLGKQRCPRRGRRGAHQDRTRLHLREVIGRAYNAGWRGHPTRADGEAPQPRAGGLVVSLRFPSRHVERAEP